MKHFTAPRIALLAIALASVLITSCRSNVTNLQQKFRPTYHAITVEADHRTAYDAARSALTQMGYRITASGAAQGKIEAISNIDHSGLQSTARQFTASVRFNVAPANNTAIQILFTEIQEDAFNSRDSMGTKQPLASSPLYGVFEMYVNAAIKQAAPEKAPSTAPE